MCHSWERGTHSEWWGLKREGHPPLKQFWWESRLGPMVSLPLGEQEPRPVVPKWPPSPFQWKRGCRWKVAEDEKPEHEECRYNY